MKVFDFTAFFISNYHIGRLLKLMEIKQTTINSYSESTHANESHALQVIFFLIKLCKEIWGGNCDIPQRFENYRHTYMVGYMYLAESKQG